MRVCLVIGAVMIFGWSVAEAVITWAGESGADQRTEGLKLLDSSDPFDRAWGISCLVPPDGGVPLDDDIRRVAKLLRDDPSAVVKELAANFLCRWEPPGEEVLTYLKEALRDPPCVTAAAIALGSLGRRDETARAILLAGFEGSSSESAQTIARIGFRALGPSLAPVMKRVIGVCRASSDYFVVASVLSALEDPAIVDPLVEQYLSELLCTRNGYLRGHAAQTLGYRGTCSESDLRVLVKMTKSESQLERLCATFALARSSGAHVEHLKAMFTVCADPVLEPVALRLMATLEPADEAAVGFLVAALEGGVPTNQRRTLVGVLGGYWQADADLVKFLGGFLRDPALKVRLGAVTALAKQGVRHKVTVVELLRDSAAKDECEEVRQAAEKVVAELEK